MANAWYFRIVLAHATGHMFDNPSSTTDPAEQTRLERAYQSQAFETFPPIPLGGYNQTPAERVNVHGVLAGPSIVFWNGSKSRRSRR